MFHPPVKTAEIMSKRCLVSSRILTAVLLLLLVMLLAGCGQKAAVNRTASNIAADQSTGQPVEQTGQPAGDAGTAGGDRSAPPPAPASIPRAEAEPAAAPPSSVSTSVYRPAAGGEKKAYLTFDDGPNNYFTPRILDILKANGARATFMVVGSNVVKNPDIVRLIVADGDGLANHTYSHDYKKIYASPQAFIADLNRCSEAVQAVTGQPVKVFRAPGGPQNLKPAFWQAVKANGYYSVSWNVVGGDASSTGVTAEQVYQNVLSGLDRVEKLHLTPIILLHDGAQLDTWNAPPGSPLGRYIESREAVLRALPQIIDLLKSRGYTFAIADQNTPAAW